MSAVLTELLILLSLSARRAWIEMFCFRSFGLSGVVALRKESVDRNLGTRVSETLSSVSLSARRAWIEMLTFPGFGMEIDGRSPQGERG